ncbi:S1 family peptidase [Lysinibacter sp. HNR]|uniref:S1 family peptidase n=1 Tax=Lysinibacter sp. HNR TaxID=3031408 RepID=UPI002434C0D3|nr:S1 family peptidase [Lysinibacter sp. HNR]WGD36914.1 S1 family peptidase [Lysinibacter sp. HNR]
MVGGAGYFTAPGSTSTTGDACSVGFTAYTPTGGPAVISAGHCTNLFQNKEVWLTLPSGDSAYTGNLRGPVEPYAVLGTYGFSRFGSPSDGIGSETKSSIDISVVNVTNNALTLEPFVTNWSTAGQNNLSLAGTHITALGEAQVGRPISKSGRSSGLTGASAVTYVDGWANVSGHIVYGFGVEGLKSIPGDSGGAMFQGTTAVGVVSGGAAATLTSPSFVWGSDLSNALQYTGGYTLRLALSAPVMTSFANHAQINGGATISGTAPAGSKVVVTPSGHAAFSATTNSQGVWSFAAPQTPQTYTFGVHTENGFNKSSVTTYSLTVAGPAAPVT